MLLQRKNYYVDFYGTSKYVVVVTGSKRLFNKLNTVLKLYADDAEVSKDCEVPFKCTPQQLNAILPILGLRSLGVLQTN